MEALDLLQGIHVVDLGLWRPVPFATQLLAELGAQVTKVEPPGGDPMRAFPALERSLNDRKEIVELDLKSDDGRAEALALCARADVVAEGFRPGVADRLGVGAAAVRSVRPDVVYCSVSGFGQFGPLRDAPGHDLNYQAWSGMLAARLPEVTRSGVPIADLAGGTYAALAICAALVARARTGHGRTIDVAMTDVLVSWAAPSADGSLTEGDDPAANFPAYGSFVCADGWVTIGVVTEVPFWRALCELLGLDDVAELDTEARAVRGAELRLRIATELAARSRDPLVDALVTAGVPAAPVLDRDEALAAAHAQARGLSSVDAEGRVHLRHPVRFSDEGDGTDR